MARIVLSMIAEPDDLATGYILGRHGGVATLHLAESDHDVTGLARADVLLWRERLRSRTTPDLMDRVDEAQQRRFGILIPADREWPTGLDELGDRAPYLFVDAGRFFISGGRAGWETPPRHRCTCRRDRLTRCPLWLGQYRNLVTTREA